MHVNTHICPGKLLGRVYWFLLTGGLLLIASSCGRWFYWKWQRLGANGCQNKGSLLSPDNSWYSCGCGALRLYPTLKIFITPISLWLVSNLQVFQKCTFKDLGIKNLVEPTNRIEPQIKELRPGNLLPHKEKKVTHVPPCSCPTNRLPPPAVWCTNCLLFPNTSSTPVLLLWLERNL